MNKDESLEKKHTEKMDKGKNQAQRFGAAWGYTGMMCFCLVLWLGTIFVGGEKETSLRLLNAIIFFAIGWHLIGEGVSSRRKFYWVIGILQVLNGIVFAVLYFKSLIG